MTTKDSELLLAGFEQLLDHLKEHIDEGLPYGWEKREALRCISRCRYYINKALTEGKEDA